METRERESKREKLQEREWNCTECSHSTNGIRNESEVILDSISWESLPIRYNPSRKGKVAVIGPVNDYMTSHCCILPVFGTYCSS